MTSTQLSEWQAFSQIEPMGEQVQDYRFAVLLSAITNLFRWAWGKKGSPMTKPMDFIPQWYDEEEMSEEPVIQSVEEMKRIFRMMAGKNIKKRE